MIQFRQGHTFEGLQAVARCAAERQVLAEVGRSTPAAGEPRHFHRQGWSGSMVGMDNAMVMMGGGAAGHGQFRWRS